MKIGDRVEILERFGHFEKGSKGTVKQFGFYGYENIRKINVYFDIGILLDGDNKISGWEFKEVKKVEK